MEKTDKSAEEIDERLLVKRIWQRAYLDTEESHVMLIRDYAAHQLSEYKEVIKELLPLARSVVYNTSINTEEGRKNVREIQAIIDRAKKLIE